MNNKYYLLLAGFFCFYSQAQSQTSFTDVGPTSGITHNYFSLLDMGGGCAFFDYNQDGFLDIYYTGGYATDALYQNNGDGTFTDVTISAGLGATANVTTMGVTTGDIDNDGYREIFLTSLGHAPSLLFKNNGDGTFADISASSGIQIDTFWGLSASFGDYDQDGYLDLYVGNYVDTIGITEDSAGNFIAFSHLCVPNRLFHNNGDNTFSDVAASMGVDDAGCNLAATFTDYDSDGDVDIYSVNDFGEWISPSMLLQNDYPSASFTDVSAPSGMDEEMYGMGIAVGDYDQDSDLDYYVTNIGRNILHRNNGDGTFTDTTTAAGVENRWVIPDSIQSVGWGTGFVDVDHDSYLDLFVANGYIQALGFLMTAPNDPSKLYHNNGDGTFTDISAAAGVEHLGMERAFAFGDYDNDGDNDLTILPIVPLNPIDTLEVVLYRNDLNNTNNWLKVNLQGTVSNRDAYGSQLIIHVGGQSWMHEISGGASHGSQHSSIAHFGLGTNLMVDSLQIYWTNGLQETYYDIAANQKIDIVEGFGVGIDKVEENTSFFVYPNPAQQEVYFRYNLDQASSTEIQIMDALGRIVWRVQGEQAAGDHTQKWQAQKLPNGIYMVQLKIGATLLSEKLILQR